MKRNLILIKLFFYQKLKKRKKEKKKNIKGRKRNKYFG